MSFFALGLTLCTAFTCNTYNIDTSSDSAECKSQLKEHSASFVEVWVDIRSVVPLKTWLEQFQIFEEPAEVERYNFECIEYGSNV